MPLPSTLSSYVLAVLCPVLTCVWAYAGREVRGSAGTSPSMVLRARYAMSDTDIAHAVVLLRAR
eukprot:1602117-Rhodomonas_salina.7